MTRAMPAILHLLLPSRLCAWPAGSAAPSLHQSPNPAARRPDGATPDHSPAGHKRHSRPASSTTSVTSAWPNR